MRERLAGAIGTVASCLLGGCAAPVLLAPCLAKVAMQLHNPETGEVLTATYKLLRGGRGQITVAAADGKVLRAEGAPLLCASFRGDAPQLGTVAPSCTAGYEWAIARGFSFNQPGKAYGHWTVATGDLVIELVHAWDIWGCQVNGVGRDNKGGKWQVRS